MPKIMLDALLGQLRGMQGETRLAPWRNMLRRYNDAGLSWRSIAELLSRRCGETVTHGAVHRFVVYEQQPGLALRKALGLHKPRVRLDFELPSEEVRDQFNAHVESLGLTRTEWLLGVLRQSGLDV